MSKFEFVTIIYSLIVAFGVPGLLAALERMLRDRAHTPVFAPQLIALGLLLLAFLQSLWGNSLSRSTHFPPRPWRSRSSRSG